MTTKYNIGDVVVVVDYYDKTFASNIIGINIDKDGIMYTLDKTESDENNITLPETTDSDVYYRIIKLVGTIY